MSIVSSTILPSPRNPTNHIVSISGGSASAVAASRVIERYGKDAVTLWFADTKWEDEDLYRFLIDLETRWDMTIERFTDGRNPLQVAEHKKIIPNAFRAACSYELKQKHFMRFIKGQPKPLTVHLGLSWDEEHRMAKPKATYEKVDGVTVDYPLIWKPLPLMAYTKTVQEWGIKPPRLYELGFPHNNCGGRCVRQGQREWLRLKRTMPERFEEVAAWEQVQRTKSKTREGKAILKETVKGQVTPLTLRELENRQDTDQIEMFPGDNFGCFCEY